MATSSARMVSGARTAASPATTTLRTLIDARRAQGVPMTLAEAIAVVVPVCLDLNERHAAGERLFVHPSSIAPGEDGLARVHPALSAMPQNHADRACLAPEVLRTNAAGDACATVFALGAMLYEMVTHQSVGPGMHRPRDINPDLPDALELVLAKALVGDRAHRPADLAALASAMYQLAPQQSVAAPVVSQGRLDASAELDVDVKFSVLPPSQAANGASGVTAIPRAPVAPRVNGGDPFGAPVIDQHAARMAARKADDPTTRLAAMKAELESDPRPRYVVIKDSMDHGPFTAVELLQQIASHHFVADDGLRDEIGGQQQNIGEWAEFAPFAEQARLLREKRAEEKAVVVAADADKKQGLAKTIIAVSAVLALGGALTVWFLARRGTHNDDVVVQGDRAGVIEIEGDIKGRKRPTKGHAGAAGGPGFSGGASFESVLASNNQTINMGQGGSDTPDLTNAQLSAPLRNAAFITGCGAPDDMKVTVQVAVRMGRAVGVTVRTNPSSGGVAACIDRAVRGLQWPANAKTDFVTTNY
jgi:nucleoid-associated protein YgaU